MVFAPRSPHWQALSFLEAPTACVRGVRAFPKGDPEPIMSCAARNGFWDLGAQTLRKLASHMGVSVASDAKLFDILMGLTKECLRTSEHELLPFMSERAVALGKVVGGTGIQELMALDGEGLELVGRDERQELTEERKHIEQVEGELRDFCESCKLARARAGAGRGTQRKPRPKVLPPGEIDQATARQFVLGGASVWRDNTRHGWQCHFPPFQRCSALNSICGDSRQALVVVLRTLWRQHNYLNSAAEKDCPVAGLFEVAGPTSLLEGGGNDASQPAASSGSGSRRRPAAQASQAQPPEATGPPPPKRRQKKA